MNLLNKKNNSIDSQKGQMSEITKDFNVQKSNIAEMNTMNRIEVKNG